jgi:hypothetical protein
MTSQERLPSPLRGKSRAAEWPDEKKQLLRDLWAAGGTISSIARAMNTTRGAISGKSMRMHLHFAAKPMQIEPGGERDVAAVSIFHNSAVQSPVSRGVLKPGGYQRKLGGKVLKGAWKGMPIFSLTLEERATCPRSCAQWLNCYGNNMGRSVRYRAGAELEDAITVDLVKLERLHPRGFVVRLHILGDFYSTEYVEFWRAALGIFPGLRVFGYTARQLSDPIGQLIAELRDECWDRFAVRTSGASAGPRTLVVDKPGTIRTETQLWAQEAIVCPAQTGGTSHCGACALCWSNSAKHRAIAFLAH